LAFSVALLDTSKVDGEGDGTCGIRDLYPPASPVGVRFRPLPTEFTEDLDGLTASLLEIGHANSNIVRDDFVSVGQMEIVAVHLRSHVIRVPARRYGECGQPPTRSELLQLRTADETRCSLAPSDLGTGILASAYGSASPGRMTLLRPASRLHDTGVNYRSREPRSHNARTHGETQDHRRPRAGSSAAR
jgi:hypothetical protein